MPEIISFRASLPTDIPPMYSDGPSPFRGVVQLGRPGAPKAPAKKVTLAELAALASSQSSDGFECVVRISDNTTRFDWHYLACPRCRRRLEDPEENPHCTREGCSKDCLTPVPWYRFTVKVEDQTGASRFVLIGKQAEVVVGAPAEAIMPEDMPDSKNVPAKFLEIIGKQFLFTITGREGNEYAQYQSYTVQRVGPVPPDHPQSSGGAVQPTSSSAVKDSSAALQPASDSDVVLTQPTDNAGAQSQQQSPLVVEPATPSVAATKRVANPDEAAELCRSLW